MLVAPLTSPDWVPTIRRAAAVVTDGGGITCHAAIISRELGVPCVVGTQVATTTLHDDDAVTVDRSKGMVLRGRTAAVATAAVTPPSVMTPAYEPPATPIYVNRRWPSTPRRSRRNRSTASACCAPSSS